MRFHVFPQQRFRPARVDLCALSVHLSRDLGFKASFPMLLQRFVLKLQFNGSYGALTHYRHCFNSVFKTFFLFVSTVPGRIEDTEGQL